MQRKLSIVFIVMLLLQTISGSFALPSQVNATSEKSSILKSTELVNEAGEPISKDQNVKPTYLEVKWGTKGVNPEVDKAYKISAPDGWQIENEQKGTLTYEEKELGNFTATQDNMISATLNEAIHNSPEASGTFKVEVVKVKAKEPEEDANQGSQEKSETDNEQEKQPSTEPTDEKADATEKSDESSATQDESTKEDQEKNNSSSDNSNQQTAETQSQQEKSTETNDNQQDNKANEKTVIEKNIIEEGTLVLETNDGTPVNENDPIDLEDGLNLKFDWALPNGHGYTEGDTFELQLPNQFAELSLPDGNLNGYGTYSVNSDGLVTFTFSDKIEKESNITGDFNIQVELDEEKITTTEDELEFKVNDEVVERIPVNYQPTGGQAIYKEGKHADGRKFNTEAIDWTVNVNTTLESLKNADITDDMKQSQELDLDSIELYEAKVDIKGNVISVKDEPIDISGMDESTSDQLQLNLGDTNKAYQLKFTTNINDDKGTEYTNTAVLSSDGKEDASSGATISVGRQVHLEKTSSNFNKENHSVDWTVKYNFDEKHLEKDNELTDEFTFMVGEKDLSKKFEVTDIAIKQVDSFNDDGSVNETTPANDLFNQDIDGNKVTYTLKEDTSEPFIIEYKTQLKEGEYITHDGEISNTVTVDGETETSGQGIGQQVGEKSHSDINYEDKTIDWTIKVNKDNRNLNNFILTDNFSGSGQKLVEGSIEISPEKADATTTINEDSEGFEIDFGDITESYTIKYTTEFTYDFAGDNPKFTNNLDLEYETSDRDKYSNEITDDVKPNDKTTSNGAKNGKVNKETKEITWTVDINYNQLNLKDADFTDVIKDSQSLIDGSIAIYETSVNQDGSINVGSDVTESYTVNTNDGEKISINFGQIDQSYRIVFKTKDDDDVYNSNEKYKNTAVFEPRDGESHELDAHVTLPNQGEFVGKNGTHNKDEWKIDWKVNINKSASTLTDVEVTDDLGDKNLQLLLEDSFELKKDGKTLQEGEDYNLDVTGNSFTLDGLGEITDHYVLTYASYILVEETADLTNNAEIKTNEEVVGTTEKEDTVKVRIGQAGGGGQGETAELVLNKVDKDSSKSMDGVPFKLKTTVGKQEIVVREGKTNQEGKISWSGLKYGTYTLHETVPENYTGESSVEVVLDSDDMSGNVKEMTIENERQKGTAMILKQDAVTGENLKNAKFTITNLATDQDYTLTTDEIGLAKKMVPFGKYSVEEIEAPKGYEAASDIRDIEIKPDKTATITVNNDAILDVAGQKTWKDGNSTSDRPDAITVNLLQNGVKVDSKEITAEIEWKYSFTDLAKYDESGSKYNYTVEEKAVDGYEPIIDGYDITNVRAGTTNVAGTKTWQDDNSDDRPDKIKVNLLQNNVVVDTKEFSAEDDWKYSFTGLEKYDSEGIAYSYTVKEQDVPGYDSEVNGFDITNTRSETKSIEVTKAWLDDNSNDRPDSITVDLLQNGNVIDTVDVTAEDDWTYTFKDLEAFDENGVAYDYTIQEKKVEGYKTTVDGFDITNLRVGITSVKGEKTWKDEEDALNRPDSITVNLLQNGEKVDSKEVTTEDNWEYNFTDLAKYDDKGVAYDYTVEEEAVDGYKATVDGYDITNTRIGKTEVSGTKTWKDEDSSDRPDAITVNLLQNGEKIDSKEVTAEGNWTYSFRDLAKYDDKGISYNYTIQEEEVEGYKTTIAGYDITNLRVGTTSVEGEKTWKDADASARSDAITVNLLQNGEKVDSKEVTAEADWKYSFTDLDEFDEQGVAYDYTVEEKAVGGYETTIDGYDITNVRVGTTEVSGTKSWKDDNADNRPDTITVNLLQNNVVVDTKEVTATDGWKYSFTGLEEYDSEGIAYSYTVKEQDVPGYDSEVNGYDITNTRSETKSIEVTKAWLDDNSNDRPDSITVDLLQNGTVIDTVDVTAEDEWIYEFKGLEAFDENGVAYEYSIQEEDVKGYTSKIDGYDMTNTRTGTSNIDVSKEWKNDTTEDRPDSITVELLQNGDVINKVELTADMNWTHVFTELDKYDEDGFVYNYSVQEQDVAGYKSTVNETDSGFTITNTKEETIINLDDSTKPGNPGSSDDSSNALPQTGETWMRYMLILGLLSLGAGGSLLFSGRKKRLD